MLWLSWKRSGMACSIMKYEMVSVVGGVVGTRAVSFSGKSNRRRGHEWMNYSRKTIVCFPMLSSFMCIAMKAKRRSPFLLFYPFFLSSRSMP